MASSLTQHSAIWIIMAFAATITSIGLYGLYMKQVVFNDAYGTLQSTDLFERYHTLITPHNWSLDASLVFFLQIGWLIHVLINILRSSNGGPFYKNPEIVSAPCLSMYSLGVLLNMLCLIMADNGYKDITVLLWILVWLAFTLAIMDYYLRVKRNVKKLAEEHKIDLLLYRILLQNGLSLYIMWCMISNMLNLAIVLRYSFELTMDTACVMTLTKMAVEFLVFMLLDMWFLERYVRYTFAPYLALIWFLYGGIAANWDPTKASSILSVILLVECILGLAMKVVSTVVRARKQPLYASF